MGSELMRPEIFGYHDARALLRDVIEFEKSVNSEISIRLLANKSGIATGFLPMYLSGKRRMTLETAQKLSRSLPLSDRERRFFLLLVELDNADGGPDRVDILGRLQNLGAYKDNNKKEFEVHKYLKCWFHVAIRELSLLPDFRPDPKWIKNRLRTKVPLGEIKEALDFLTTHNFILQHEGKYFQNPEKDLDCIDGVFKISLAAFHRQMLELAMLSIDQLNSKKRIVIGQTIPIRLEDFETAKTILSEALDKIQKLQAANGNGDHVYHFTLAGFPLTNAIDESEDLA
jgi:uncharacterized protein (TIGR02147 family)